MQHSGTGSAKRVPLGCDATRSTSTRHRSRVSVMEDCNQDVLDAILEALPCWSFPSLKLVNKRWAETVRAGWPGLCARRFPHAHMLPFVSQDLIWLVATNAHSATTGAEADADTVIEHFLSVLAQIETTWHGALQVIDEPMVVERVSRLRELMSIMHLPADAALMYFLGLRLESTSPMGTISGDFGPEFAHDTPREPWAIGLRWPALDDAFLDEVSQNGASPAEDLQTLRDFALFLDHQPHGTFYANADSALLCCMFASFDMPGTELWLTLEAPPHGDNGGISCVVFSSDERDDRRFEAKVDGRRMTLTRLLELVLHLVEPHAGKFTWHEAWHKTDLYQGICDALDAADNGECHRVPSEAEVDSDGSQADDDEEEDGEDGYPSSMLGDESD